MPMTVEPSERLELEQLAGHRAAQTLDAGDTVADLGDRADLTDSTLVLIASSCDRRTASMLTGGDLRHLRFTSSVRSRAPRRTPRAASRLASMQVAGVLMTMPPMMDGVDLLAKDDALAQRARRASRRLTRAARR